MGHDTVKTIGLERANAFFQQTLEIEANGGMETANGKRRRTPGGGFLYLVRKNVSTEERKDIFPKNRKTGTKRKKSSEKTAVNPLKWEDALKYVRALLQHEKGQARSVEVKLIGRPAKVAKTQSCMVVMMEGKSAPKSLPKGLPTPPEQSQPFAVFISNNHWKKASEELKASKNADLLMRGHPVFQPEEAMTMLLAQAVEVIERKPKTPKTE